MDLAEKISDAVSNIADNVGDMRESVQKVLTRLREVEEDIDILFESQDMNVWVLVRGICEGSIAPGEDPEDVLRAMARLQTEYRFAVSLASFLRRMAEGE